jgi:hypothetical protein
MCGGKLHLRRFMTGGNVVDYRIFNRLSREFSNKKISEGLFALEWAMEQKRQGITPPAGDQGRRSGKEGCHAV